MIWKRFLIITASVLVAAGAIKLVWACADGPDPFENGSFFLSSVNDQPAFDAFSYMPYTVFYTDGWDAGSVNAGTNANIASWNKYTGTQVPVADIDSFVYKFAAADVHNLFEHIRKGYTLKVPDNVASNKLTQWFIKNRDHEAALYLAFAKTCEPYAAAIEYNWNDITNKYETTRRDSAAMQELVHEGIKRIMAANNAEIKLRYAYQCMRMAFYSGEYGQTQLLFNTLIIPSKHNLYYRCLSLQAGALFRTGDKARAAYLYSRVFDSSDEQKQQAHTSYRWANGNNIAAVLPRCRTAHEQAVLYVMNALYDFDGDAKTIFSAMRTAYKLDPGVRGIDIAMTRIINKLEMDMAQQIILPGAKNNALLTELSNFARQAAHEAKAGRPSYWTLASAYLELLNGNLTACKKELDAAARTKMSQSEQMVHSIVTSLHIITRAGKVTPAAEADMLPYLKTMEQNAAGATSNNLYCAMMTKILCRAYLQQHDSAKALFCIAKYYSSIPRYGTYFENIQYWDIAWELLESMSPAQIQQIASYRVSSSKSSFENWLTDNSAYLHGILFELKGTKHLRNLEYGLAVEAFQQVPDTMLNKKILPDPLVSHIKENSEWNRSDRLVTYNKLTLSRKMNELKLKVDAGPEDGRAAYQYANALYSISYYGKAFAAYTYYHSSSDEKAYYVSKYRNGMNAADKEYYGLALAEKYYKQALEHSTDIEVKARCLFMAAKCWQKNCPSPNDDSYYSWDANEYYVNALKNPYFRQLKTGYSGTRLYGDALGGCSYLRDYVRKSR
jgi:hypothetical protein